VVLWNSSLTAAMGCYTMAVYQNWPIVWRGLPDLLIRLGKWDNVVGAGLGRNLLLRIMQVGLPRYFERSRQRHESESLSPMCAVSRLQSV
jgi:hypothetical protein